MAKRSKKQLDQALKPLDLQAQQQQQVEDLKQTQLEPTDTGTRHLVAKLFVAAYFGLMMLIIIGVPIYNLVAFKIAGEQKILQIPLGDILQTYSAIVGTSLGFVIAYYFKTKNEN